ncbi:MAG: FAD-binding oxidoreductase [Pseudomonadota bacterium]|nr:FAD-binding oxidoreductase [Pseudomonadota bacterium]
MLKDTLMKNVLKNGVLNFKPGKILNKLKDSEPSIYVDFMLQSINPMWSYRKSNAKIVAILADTPQSSRIRIQPNGRWDFKFLAGQHLPITININGAFVQRYYSISSSPEFYEANGVFDITVKEQTQGIMSHRLNQGIKVGDIIEIGAPQGEFILPKTPTPLLFIAAGSGITPMYSMVESVYFQYRRQNMDFDIEVLYYGREKQNLILYKELAKICQDFPAIKLKYIPVADKGYFKEEHLQEFCSDYSCRKIYLCGPTGFIKSTLKTFKEQQVPDSQIMVEYFGAAQEASEEFKAGKIHFENSNVVIDNTDNKSLLEIAESNKVYPTHGCRQGICKRCQCSKAKGTVYNTRTQEWHNKDNETIELCTSIPVGDVSLSI